MSRADAPTIVPAVARHFDANVVRAAESWLDKHDHELPKADKGNKVFPDAIQQKIRREMRRVSERQMNVEHDGEPELKLALSEEDYDALVESTPDTLHRSREMQAILGRIEAAAVAAHHARRRERSAERFMATADEYLEPYFAVKKGMSLVEAARRFNVADIQAHMAAVEQWLSTLEVAVSGFNRSVFLARLERAIDKRRRDAIRIAPVGIPRELRVRKSHTNAPASAVHLHRHEPIPASINPPGCRLDTPETDRALAKARSLPPNAVELRNRQLERGLIALLELIPHGPRTLELVRIVDMTKEGKSQREIASTLDMDRRKVSRRLELILKAGEVTLLSGVELAKPEAVSHDSVSGLGSIACVEKCTSSDSPAVYI